MAVQTKPKFPSKPCPKCGKLIHARLQKHPDCGWTSGQTKSAMKPVKAKAKNPGRPKAAPMGGISLDDIRAVKEVVSKLGAEKVRQLAEVFSK